MAQAFAGAVVVFTKVAEASQMLHAGIVSLIFGSLCYVALQTLASPRRAAQYRSQTQDDII